MAKKKNSSDSVTMPKKAKTGSVPVPTKPPKKAAVRVPVIPKGGAKKRPAKRGTKGV